MAAVVAILPNSTPTASTVELATLTSVPDLAPVSESSSESDMESLPSPTEPTAPSAQLTSSLAPAFQQRANVSPVLVHTATTAPVKSQYKHQQQSPRPRFQGHAAPIRHGRQQHQHQQQMHSVPAPHSSSRRGMGHARSISMPDAAIDRPASPSAQYNAAWDNLALKYLRTPQLNNLEHVDSPPSPPSSPDSVLFIEHLHNTGQPVLPRNFLRRRGNSLAAFDRANYVVEEPAPDATNWLQFESPPRPIPALHGPSSLPYARCPSGAEGTIIEEQSTLPTVIWGLDTREGEISSNAAENGSVSDLSGTAHQPPHTFRPQQNHRFDRHGGGNSRNRQNRVRGPRHPRQPLPPHVQQQQQQQQQHIPRIPTLSYEDLLRATVRPGHAAQYGVHYGLSRNTPGPNYGPAYSSALDEIEEQLLLARLRAEAALRMDRQVRPGSYGPPYVPQQHHQHHQRQQQLSMPPNVKPNLIALLDVSQSPTDGTGYASKVTPPSTTTPTFAGQYTPLADEQLTCTRAWASPNTPSSIASLPSIGSITSLTSSSHSVEGSPSTAELSDQLRRLVLGPRGTGEDPGADAQNQPRGAVSLPATPMMTDTDVMGRATVNYRSPGARVNTGGQMVSAWDILQGRRKSQPVAGTAVSPSNSASAGAGGKTRDPTSPGTPGAGMARRLRVGPAAVAASGALAAALATVPEEPDHGSGARALPVPIPPPGSPVAEKKAHRGAAPKSTIAASWRKQRVVDGPLHVQHPAGESVAERDCTLPPTPVVPQEGPQSRPPVELADSGKRVKIRLPSANGSTGGKRAGGGRGRKTAKEESTSTSTAAAPVTVAPAAAPVAAA